MSMSRNFFFCNEIAYRHFMHQVRHKPLVILELKGKMKGEKIKKEKLEIVEKIIEGESMCVCVCVFVVVWAKGL